MHRTTVCVSCSTITSWIEKYDIELAVMYGQTNGINGRQKVYTIRQLLVIQDMVLIYGLLTLKIGVPPTKGTRIKIKYTFLNQEFFKCNRFNVQVYPIFSDSFFSISDAPTN